MLKKGRCLAMSLWCPRCPSEWLDLVPSYACGLQLPVDVTPVRQVMAQVTEFMASTWETWIKFPAPHFDLAQPQLLWTFRKWTGRWELFPFVSALCLSNWKQTNKQGNAQARLHPEVQAMLLGYSSLNHPLSGCLHLLRQVIAQQQKPSLCPQGSEDPDSANNSRKVPEEMHLSLNCDQAGYVWICQNQVTFLLHGWNQPPSPKTTWVGREERGGSLEQIQCLFIIEHAELARTLKGQS